MSAEGITDEEFRAVNGLAKVPPVSQTGKVPVIYDEACKAVVACTTINDAKYWSDKADALAAWAKIYCEDRVSIEAKRLKLHAYRRMADLADSIMPAWRAERNFRVASVPIILVDHGVPRGEARIIGKIGEMPASKVKQAIARKKPPTPATLAMVEASPFPEWTRIKRTMSSLASMIKDIEAQDVASKMPQEDQDRAYEMATDIMGWCVCLNDALETMVEKVPPKVAINGK